MNANANNISVRIEKFNTELCNFCVSIEFLRVLQIIKSKHCVTTIAAKNAV